MKEETLKAVEETGFEETSKDGLYILRKDETNIYLDDRGKDGPSFYGYKNGEPIDDVESLAEVKKIKSFLVGENCRKISMYCV